MSKNKDRHTIIFFANTDWYLYNFRISLAKALIEAGHDLLLVSPPGEYGQRLLAEGFRWQPLPMERRSLNIIRELALLLYLFKLFLREKPLLIHNFTIKAVIYGSLAALFAGIPYRVNAVTGMGYVFISDNVKAKLLRPFVRELFRIALGGKNARLILQNPDDLSLFRSAKLVNDKRIHLIRGSGVDCVRFSPVAKEGLNQPLKVLLAARLLWDKGLDEYVSAARQLKAEGRPVHFLLAGEPDPGNPASVPVETLKEWISGGLLEWLGHIDDMPRILRAVDVMVLPSYREGLPKGLIEAAACGLAIVTTDVPGCREVVTDGIDGLLVPVRDANALANSIRRLQDNPDLTARLGAAARKKALTEFEVNMIIRKTTIVYEELIGQ